MVGRLEQENKQRKKIEKKLNKLPNIFRKFYDWMDTREKSFTTMNNYINHVVEFMNYFTKGKNDEEFYKRVTEDDIEKFMTSIRRKNIDGNEIRVGDDIRAAKWSSLNTFFKFLYTKHYITDNPMLLTERPKIKTEHAVTYLTPEEIASIFKRIEEEGRPMTKNRDICIVALGLGTGLRVSAIVNINVEDINFISNTIKVIEKGNKTREISFGNNLKSLLLMWLKDREIFFQGDNAGPLFLSQLKTRMSTDSVEHLVKKYTDHLSKKITPHKLRSSAAMNLYGAGVDVLTIASILGHDNVTTTQRYVEAYDKDRKNATNILDNLI